MGFNSEMVSFEDVCGPVSLKAVAFAQNMLRDSIDPIRNSFEEYIVFPYSISGLSRSRQGFVIENVQSQDSRTRGFRHGYTWWAYSFGLADGPNDVPNISICGNSTCLDVALCAWTHPSQKVMLDRILKSTSQFDSLLNDHGRLWLKTFLKFEHQPRTYHWIGAEMKTPGEFDGSAILHMRRNYERMFNEERERWIRFIVSENKELTQRQIHHIETHSKRPNLAISLSEPIQKEAPFWSLSSGRKVSEVVGVVQRLKPLIDFFLKG